MIGLRVQISVKDGRLFISDKSYHRFLIELKHGSDKSWRQGLMEES